ncbi:MAG: TraM recognition domain-containing protein [Opitutaceae bacterium]
MSPLRPLTTFWRCLVVSLARRMPIESPVACMGFSVLFSLTAFFLLPGMEEAIRSLPLLADAMSAAKFGWRALRVLEWTMIWAAFLCAGMFQARCLQICFPETYDAYAGENSSPGLAGGIRRGRLGRGRKRHGFTIAGMPASLDDLCTSVLVTGVTGSSKTAGVLMPAAAQLLAAYNEETDGDCFTNPFQKLGAFIPEVKGDLVDGFIYLAQEAGRCVSRDVIIISPCSRIPVVCYRDERGRRWFLSGRGGAGGSEAAALVPKMAYPPGHRRAGRQVGGDVFESKSDFGAVLDDLSKISVPLGSHRPRFLGWRWRGRELLRISHTACRDQAVPRVGADGAQERTTPPRFLRVEGVTHIDNGVHYNLIDPRLPPAEAAERMTRLAAMSRGGQSHGENDYFYEQGRKLIAACITLHRAVETSPCTAMEIVRLATQDDKLESALCALTSRIERTRGATAGLAEDEMHAAERRELAPLEDLLAYFRNEWQRMVADGKTANVIKSTISGVFDVFLQDPDLAETFCRPSTFSFEDILQSGKIIGLVPGDRYEQLGRLLGSACKLDFQSTMLSRTSRPDLNGTRLALYLADECHKYVISGSSTAGDPYFMNLSRSNNVVNLCATQSYAWIVEVLGREAANVFISAFGVQFWLQQTDPETCRRAAEICGTVMREEISADHNLNFGGVLEALGTGREIRIRHQVRCAEKERFRAEDFAHLNVGDIIAYNKGRKGRAAKVVRGRAAYHFCTKKPDGVNAVRECVREYYRGLLENIAHERGETGRWDCRSDAMPADSP